jgi:type IV pilus assembly protein PilX
MLVNQDFRSVKISRARRQSGVVMLVALIVLVVMTLAGIALIRSMDTTNLIAGNMAFKQSAVHGADAGVEAAINVLTTNSALGGLDQNIPAIGYVASTLDDAGYKTYALGADIWGFLSAGGVCNLPIIGGANCSAAPVPDPVTGNAISFVMQRLCNTPGSRTNAAVDCAVTPSGTVAVGGNLGSGDQGLTLPSSEVYYRITVKVVGPRNATSYVQAIVSM